MTSKKRRQVDRTGLVHALLYTRVSGSEAQTEGLSLPVQEQTTRAYAAARPGWMIAGEFQDIMSGRRSDRPGYQSMLAQARALSEAGHRLAVVAVRQDRLERSMLESVRARAYLAELGSEVHTIKEGGVLPNLTAHVLMSRRWTTRIRSHSVRPAASRTVREWRTVDVVVELARVAGGQRPRGWSVRDHTRRALATD